MRPSRLGLPVVLALTALVAPPLLAGFAGTDVVVPAVARRAGAAPAQFYSSVWVTNPSLSTPATVEVRLYLQGQANPDPPRASFTLGPGESRSWGNVVSELLGLSDVSGALRFVSNTPLLVSSRTYDLPPGAAMRDTKGLFFAAIPASFAIAAGETAHLQGVVQGDDFRYNFGLVELGGKTLKVRATLRGPSGLAQGSKEYELGGREARQLPVTDLLGAPEPGSRIEVTALSGEGAALVYGTQIAQGSVDSAGFEMSFKDGLLASATASSAEAAAGSAAFTTVAVARAVSDLAPRIGVGGRDVPLAELPFTAAWDEKTSTWTISMTFETGQSASFALQFRDASGAAMRIYRPNETTAIWAKGRAAGLQGALEFEVVVGGVKQGTAALTVDGSGTGTCQGVSAAVTVAGLTIPKSSGTYPTSGTVTVASGGITVTVTFDGTHLAHGTYQLHNQTFTFTIDLQTGEVTR